MSSTKSQLEEYGWTAVPRDRTNVPTEEAAESKPTDLDFEKDWPSTDVVRKAQEYVKGQLSTETYNHSIRVYHYGEPLP